MSKRWILFVCAVLGLVATAAADEGMWLFNQPPTEKIKAKYDFTLTQAWLDHTRLSSVRFNDGGSGSFVSAGGLTFTNHHVAQTCLYGLSTKEKDLYKTGFYANKQADEAKCPDLELNRLVDMEDVTDKVNAGTTANMPVAELGTKQRANMANIEADCVKTTGLRCDVVTLFAGGMFHLYKYKKYTDVRLVFAPEFQTAFFGGDPDNFEYPRWDLDIAFFRVYEHDKPVKLDNFLKWSTAGTKEGDLVFVSGHPGSTGRLLTMAQMEFLRDTSYPYVLKLLSRRIKLLEQYSAQSEENARQAQRNLFGYQNSYKGTKGYESGLLDKSLMDKKAAEEQRLKNAVMGDSNKKQQFGDPWAEVAQAQAVYKEIFYRFIELERVRGGELVAYARNLVRGAAERAKPNPRRLREYRESALPSLEQNLFAANPVYPALETLLLTDWLTEAKQQLPKDAALAEALNGKAPAVAAEEIVANTKLADPAVRKQLWEGGEAVINASTDPLIVLMKTIDPEARQVRKEYEDKVESVERSTGATLTKIRFAEEGTSMPPDATFTLRLSYGTVRGYVEDGRGSVAGKGTQVPYFTTMGGAYEHAARHGGKPPYDLAPSWIAAKPHVKLETPLNNVSTPDIIGGNSGSPVVNTAGEVVGIIFDGNIQSLLWRFEYEDVIGRSVSVDSRGILEALRDIYHADRLVDELVATGSTHRE